ncbi:MAG: transporter substrate-binding domain-containing protein, partial [Spirochaetes bacterium]|nr:transporter substrate-binding domain-containing protein [Spirochaetota bacterium]
DKENGIIIELREYLIKYSGLKIEIQKDKSWSEAYQDFINDKIDILYGANATPERQRIMQFTPPLFQVPYTLLTHKKSDIQVISDIDEKIIGFLQDDIVIDLFPKLYFNIQYTNKHFNTQDEALLALSQQKIDAFITSGGNVIYDYLNNYPSLKKVTDISKITSDMTLAVKKKDEKLYHIIDKVIKYLIEKDIDKIIKKVNILYNHQVMNLTPRELNWITTVGKAKVGVTEDYLPFDYYHDGKYLGIDGAIIKEISNFTGIEFIPAPGSFHVLYEKALKGEIHLLNIAKTDDRLIHFFYPQPLLKERDMIYGHVDQPFVTDIYGLENKKIAVIKDFWHLELLKKNLVHYELIITENLKESLQLVARKKADYLIENPTVMRFYITSNELHQIKEKGKTSSDSFIYFGVSKNMPELASIINKTLPLLDLEKIMNQGFASVPIKTARERISQLLIIVILLIITITILIFILIRIFIELAKSKEAVENLKAQEKLILQDPMTKAYNRHFLQDKVYPNINYWHFPQTIVLCDVNNLKEANDNYGHSVGDELLKTFATALKTIYPEDAIHIRLGGDEFLVILIKNSYEEVTNYTEKLHEFLSKSRIKASDSEYIIPSSAIGIAIRRNKKITFSQLMKKADDKMYKHKRKIKGEDQPF